jgi:predicted permease
MKYAMMGALLITLPAVIALIYSIIVGNHLLMYAALFSTGLNILPFIAAGLLMGKQKGGPDLEH